MPGVRHVKTEEGAKRYGKNIGEILNDDTEVAPVSKVITTVRMRSIAEQLAAAHKVKNTGLAKELQREFMMDLRIFRRGKTSQEVLEALHGGSDAKSK